MGGRTDSNYYTDLKMNETPANIEEAKKELQYLINSARKDNRLGFTIIYGVMTVVLIFLSLTTKIRNWWLMFGLIGLFLALTLYQYFSKGSYEYVARFDFKGRVRHNRIKFLEGYIEAMSKNKKPTKIK